MLVVALVVLDTFNQSVLGEGTLNNPVNSLGFAAAGKGPFTSHVLRIVSPSCSGIATTSAPCRDTALCISVHCTLHAQALPTESLP